MVFGVNKPEDFEKLMAMHRGIIGEYFIWPDAFFIFDVSAETSMVRSKQKGRKLDGHENEATLRRVRQNYLLFAKKYPNCHVINAERPPEKIFEDVKRLITAVLK
jgi:thymidylate kinase